MFRTTGFNSIRTLAARLQYFRAISSDRLACLPLELRLRGKSTRQSHGTSIFYVDINVRGGMTVEESRQAAGFDQAALDAAARQEFGNGAFEEDAEEDSSVVEEFYTETIMPTDQPEASATPPLAEKLETQARRSAQQSTVQQPFDSRSLAPRCPEECMQ